MLALERLRIASARRISMLGATPLGERDNQAALLEPTYALH
jgi:hypothetical protein